VILFSANFSERFCIIRRIERVIIKNVYRSSREVPLLWGDCNERRIFSKYFLKILQYHISFKFFQWETSSAMWTDRRTDMRKLIVALRNFANPPNNEELNSLSHQPAGERPDRFRLAFALRTPI